MLSTLAIGFRSGFVVRVSVRVRVRFVSGQCLARVRFASGSCPLRIWFVSDSCLVWLVSGLLLGSYLVRVRFRDWYLDSHLAGFVSGSCLVSVWFVSGSCLVRIWFGFGFVVGSYLVRIRSYLGSYLNLHINLQMIRL